MTRILIDGRSASRGGGYTYLVNLVPRLAAARQEDRFRVLVGSAGLERSLCDTAPPNLEIERVEARSTAAQLRFTFAGAPRRARAWRADLFLSTSEVAPVLAPCPTVASFRNPNVFSPLRQGWPAFQRARLATLRALARLSALTCERILFPSADAAAWIGDRMHLPEARRAVIHHGIDAEAFRAARGVRPHRRPYILSVSSIYRYKNFVRLIEAYAELVRRRADAPDLVIAGDTQDADYAAAMRRARQRAGSASRRILFAGEIAYEAVKAWYAHASLVVFPSYLETFGHPLLEALASDAPLVASDLPVFREIAGEAAFYVDPHRAEAIADAMEEALYQSEARRQLVKAGRERVRQFSWEQSAARLQTLFEEVLGERSARRRPLRVPA